MRFAVVVAVGFVGALPAANAKPARITWADWVGEYRGAIAWSHCTTPGAASATIALRAVDGVMTIELAPLGRMLRSMSLVSDDAGNVDGGSARGRRSSIDNSGWSARDGDVEVTVRRPRANRIALSVAYDNGCTARATLTRGATTNAACARYASWRQIATSCSKHADPLEPMSRRMTAAQCAAKSDRLELALVDAGCAPASEPTPTSTDCTELTRATDALARCGTVPPPLKHRVLHDARAILSAAATADRASIAIVTQQCRDAAAEVAAVHVRHRCP